MGLPQTGRLAGGSRGWELLSPVEVLQAQSTTAAASRPAAEVQRLGACFSGETAMLAAVMFRTFQGGGSAWCKGVS